MIGNGVDEAPRYSWQNDGNWHFFAFVFGGGNSDVYRNGVRMGATFSVSRSDVGDSPLDLLIGRGPSGQPFNGYIDDLAIYQRVLSAENIQELYARQRALR